MPTKDEVERYINSARELLKPTPVRLHHVPKWFKQALSPFRRRNPVSECLELVEHMIANMEWADHWGSTLLVQRCFGQERATEQIVFVSEPYGFSPKWATALDALAMDTGVRWSVESNSWWYPGHTVRIVIEPPTAP